MLKDITLGQYFSGNSILHRLDPRIKIISVLVYAISVFMAKNIYSFLFLLLSVVVLVAISGISYKIVLKSIKPVLFIVMFTAVINLFFTTTDEKPLIDWLFITVYPQGVITAVFVILRIVALIVGTSVLLTYTTSPMALTDGLENLLSPLKKLKVPVHEFAMMMSIALRFIPTLIEETDKIMSAQKARGADFESGNLIQRAKALVPVLVPLFISAFRRADELACAMECRLYHGGGNRTRLHTLKYSRVDALGGLVAVILCGGAIVVGFVL